MVGYTEPSEKPASETVWKKAGTLKNILDRWFDEPSVNQSLAEASREKSEILFSLEKSLQCLWGTGNANNLTRFWVWGLIAAALYVRNNYTVVIVSFRILFPNFTRGNVQYFMEWPNVNFPWGVCCDPKHNCVQWNKAGNSCIRMNFSECPWTHWLICLS